MKVIYPNQVTVVAADTENANFPAVNVLDEHPRKLYKATTNSAIITLTVASGASGLSIFNTNADTVEIEITVGDLTVWADLTAWGDLTVWGGDVPSLPIVEIYDLVDSKQIWAEYFQKDVPHEVKVTLQTSEPILEVGIIKAGPIHEFQTPLYGIHEGLYDYSIVKELSNGAMYIKKRNIVKTFDFQIYAERDPDFYRFMRDIIQHLGQDPMPWRLTDKMNWDWVVYGSLQSMPNGNHFDPEYSSIDISIIEVV